MRRLGWRHWYRGRLIRACWVSIVYLFVSLSIGIWIEAERRFILLDEWIWVHRWKVDLGRRLLMRIVCWRRSLSWLDWGLWVCILIFIIILILVWLFWNRIRLISLALMLWEGDLLFLQCFCYWLIILVIYDCVFAICSCLYLIYQLLEERNHHDWAIIYQFDYNYSFVFWQLWI